MKSEKRHELQKNELADWLGNHAEGVSEYFWPVVGGVVAAFVLAVGIAWYLNSRDSAVAVSWEKYYQAYGEREREAELSKVAKDFKDSSAAHWASLGVADLNLAKGANLMFNDRGDANAKLKDAEAAYKDVLNNARDPELITRAQFGMARTQETLCQPEEARKYYEMVAKSEKDSALGKAAARDAARMADPKTVEFLAWFATATPRKPAPIGHGGIPGFPPFNNVPSDLPERPDLSLPGPLSIDPGPLSVDPGKAPGGDPGLSFPKPADPTKPDEAPKADPANPAAPQDPPASPPAPKNTDPQKPGE